MGIRQLVRRELWLALLGVALSTQASAQTGAVPGALRSYSTVYSIGLEWDVTGDTNHDAAATLEFRKAGSLAWTPGLPLTRVNYNGSNMLAGSAFFLTPNTSYDVRLALADPDGGGETRQLSVRTRALPALPVTGRIFHVVPGAGGGNRGSCGGH